MIGLKLDWIGDMEQKVTENLKDQVIDRNLNINDIKIAKFTATYFSNLGIISMVSVISKFFEKILY